MNPAATSEDTIVQEVTIKAPRRTHLCGADES